MNHTVSKAGAAIVTIAVLLFAICMVIPFDFGSYFVCIFLSIGYVIMSAGFWNESDSDHKVVATTGIIFAAIYAVIIMLVYFAQTTTVMNESLNAQADLLLNYSKGSLMFNYDLLGYGMLALSTFFLGLSFVPKTKVDKCLKVLLMIHGVFFIGCLIMPMTGVFTSMNSGETSIGGVIALEFWCAYFIPVGILSFVHFNKEK